MARLAIRQLVYTGEKYQFTSPKFPDGIVIIEGSNGTGKSTFSDLIYFCFGGNVTKFKSSSNAKHREITSDKSNFVEMHIQINNSCYKFKRYFNSNDITVFSETEIVDIFPIFRSKNTQKVFSDWILEQLGISNFALYFNKYKGQINFSDLLRLIYHDQAQDNDKIFKKQDSDNFISDSVTFRKAIFEVLVGQTFTKYYKALDELKTLEKERTEKKGAIAAFTTTIDNFRNTEDWNTMRIQQEINQIDSQIKKLNITRKSLRSAKKVGNTNTVLINLKKELENVQVKQPSLQKELNSIYGELDNLSYLRNNLIKEVIQVKKIIFTHSQLNLFSPDTCPYCLNKVERTIGKCICGSDVDESKYERFFYNPQEYLNILKSKQKNVDTIKTAITTCNKRIVKIKEKLDILNEEFKKIQVQISSAINEKASGLDFSKLNEIDDKLLELRSNKESLQKQLSVESKRQEMEDKLNQLESQHNSKSIEVDKLEVKSREQMVQILQKFNEKYNQLMKETISNCRRASLDDSYMPVINDRDYVELSAGVPKRLMYFVTLLHISLQTEGTNFPKFLLIDTPDTAGIDDDNLKKALSKLPEVEDEKNELNYQIILTTGVNMYPDSLKNNVVFTLTENSRLLSEVNQQIS